MSHLPSEKKVFYYEMKGNPCFFADERVKMHFLERLGELRQKDGWLLFAFCITDDSAYFIIEASRISAVVRTLHNAALKQYDRLLQEEHFKREKAELSDQIKKLDSLTEIAEYSRKIHKIPIERGYVSRLEDYWWSSYLSYAGIHRWDLVDRRLLSLYFSTNPDSARQKLKAYYSQ